ncbi:hypothetical protein ABI59_15490 [Acidobacteria bacterium Mor1]|nr:hypothetical protein ABI59_15490 [Acidobacteria bacterium Mor1]
MLRPDVILLLLGLLIHQIAAHQHGLVPRCTPSECSVADSKLQGIAEDPDPVGVDSNGSRIGQID